MAASIASDGAAECGGVLHRLARDQREPERAPLASFALDAYFAPHHFDEMSADRQAHAGAGDGTAVGVEALEGAEQACLQWGRDAHPGVGDLEADRRALSPDRSRGRSVRAVVLDG